MAMATSARPTLNTRSYSSSIRCALTHTISPDLPRSPRVVSPAPAPLPTRVSPPPLCQVPPRSPPGTAHLRESVKRAPAPDGAAEEVHEVSPTDIASLVASLVGSSLADGKSPPSIDYCGFVQAFVVRDVEGDLI